MVTEIRVPGTTLPVAVLSAHIYSIRLFLTQALGTFRAKNIKAHRTAGVDPVKDIGFVGIILAYTCN